MSPKSARPLFLPLLLLIPVLCLTVGTAGAVVPGIAKISTVKGEVILQSGDEVIRIEGPGRVVSTGDQIATKQGEAQVTFNDGAVLKLNSYSAAMVGEALEESGFWIFKSKKPVRRINVFTGKVWFKSGASNTRNRVVTPGAVCTLHGSDGDFGYDPVKLQTYLNMYSGEASVIGSVIRGFFENPGVTAAQKSAVFTALAAAYTKTQEAAASKDPTQIINARVEALNVAKQAAVILQSNPDPTVKETANAAIAEIDKTVAAISSGTGDQAKGGPTTLVPTTAAMTTTTTTSAITTTVWSTTTSTIKSPSK